MKSLEGLSLRMLQRGRYPGVFADRFVGFLLGRGSGCQRADEQSESGRLLNGLNSMLDERGMNGTQGERGKGDGERQ